jgi:hypothetical protein
MQKRRSFLGRSVAGFLLGTHALQALASAGASFVAEELRNPGGRFPKVVRYQWEMVDVRATEGVLHQIGVHGACVANSQAASGPNDFLVNVAAGRGFISIAHRNRRGALARRSFWTYVDDQES